MEVLSYKLSTVKQFEHKPFDHRKAYGNLLFQHMLVVHCS